ncbi:MAG: hypothetical protein RI529_07925 [Spiribacter sp.]|nr:hypothetical protein [Spiribacter sp.]
MQTPADLDTPAGAGIPRGAYMTRKRQRADGHIDHQPWQRRIWRCRHQALT